MWMICWDILIQMTCQTRTELSPILFSSSFFFKRRINALNMWQRQLYFQSYLLSFGLLFFLPSPPGGGEEGGGASCCSALFRQQKKPGRCDKSGLASKSPQTRQRFSTWSIPDPVALSEPKIGPLFFSFFSLLLFFLLRHSRFSKLRERERALKSTLSLIQ